jgi:hypothetical protein
METVANHTGGRTVKATNYQFATFSPNTKDESSLRKFTPYRAVNTLLLSYTNQSVNVV